MILELVACMIAVSLFALWYLSPSARTKEFSEKIPGPKSYPIIGTSLSFKMVGKVEALDDLKLATETYGKVYRIWIGPLLAVVTSDLNDVQKILSSPTLIQKGYAYFLFRNWLGTGIITCSDDIWHDRRKALTPTFHFKILEEFLPIFNKCAEILVECLNTKAGQIFDVAPYTSNAALDVISKSAMGIELDAQRNPKEEYVSSIHKLHQSIGQRYNYPWLSFEPFYTLSGLKKSEDSCLECLHSLPREVLKEKKKELKNKDKEIDTEVENEYGIKKRIPFLERLMHIQRIQGAPFETDQYILDEVMTFMFAGHDSVSSTISFTLWALGKHPEIQENVYQEVAGIISRQPELRMEDTNDMKYLERVIKEALRRYPPATVIGRYIHEDTTLPSGYTVPAGSELYIPIHVIHWNPENFPEPSKFDPDRFLGDLVHPYAYLPFSAGPRNCIGFKYAMLVLKVILSKIVYNYNIKSIGEIALTREVLLRSANGINITLTKR